MPAPTALQRRPDQIAQDKATSVVPEEASEDAILEFASREPVASVGIVEEESQIKEAVQIDEEGRPRFAPAKLQEEGINPETREILIPQHRLTPIKNAWPKIYPPLVEQLQLQVMMDTKPKRKSVKLRTSKLTKDTGALQKGYDFIYAITLGFDVDDAIALLRLDDLYIETFEVKDVKSLQGEHLSRAIGRIAGKDGKMKFSIENASRTRIVLADQKIHILGGFRSIHIAREAIVSLILGSPPGKVYGNLRTVASRMKQKF